VACKQKYTKNYFEKTAWQNGMYVCGIDEVGRGCLAGPLVVAACIIPQNAKYVLKDSKILTEAEREKNYKWIAKNCWYSTSTISPALIDKINIYNATLLGMKRAFVQLIEIIPFRYELLKYLVIDAMPLAIDASHKNEVLETHYFPHGESISSSIAAASIVAKVTRDRLMTNMDKVIPGFGLEHHKGYGTECHTNSLKINGPSIIHRKSFITKIDFFKSGCTDTCCSELEQSVGSFKNEYEIKSQQSIF
jgi:ribonuclease HII